VDNASINNTISANSIYDNEYLGIDIFPPGVNANDAGDADSGPNGLMNFPVISTTGHDLTWGSTFITGTLSTQNPQNATIELFKAAPDLFFNHGEGKTYLGSATPDNAGNWAAIVSGLITDDEVTATATDATGNTSEFALNTSVVVGLEENGTVHSSFSVYPNPAKEVFQVSYELNEPSHVEISLFNAYGQKVETFFQSAGMAGRNCLKINSEKLSSGFYFLTLKTDEQVIAVEKIELIK
jgi:hypothetical protein